ncbi:methyltransferase domain-containing protein [Frigidibacter sp. MR17.14]|uniref:class I SAM-dependent methyltransferase n=1 Tax=Frigidibacter sp. MR17.14 TaxID=3126509 RepID=UPI003013087B
MTILDSSFQGSIPEVYDRALVPILFDGYAQDLAARVAREAPERVLEVAAGTGAVTRALLPLLPGWARYDVTDLNAAMLDRARMHLRDPRLHWQAADALALPFDDAVFDAVLCQFGVMFFPDRVRGYAELRRVMRPGGRLVFNSWGALARNQFSAIAVETLVRLYPQDPPLFLARTPFGYSDPEQIAEDLRDAGFETVAIERLDLTSEAETADDFAFAQCHGSPLKLEIEARPGPTLDEVRAAIAAELAARLGEHPIRGRMSALVAEAVAP